MSWLNSLSGTEFLIVAFVVSILVAGSLPVLALVFSRPEPLRPTSNDPTVWCPGCELLVRQSELVRRSIDGQPDLCEPCAREAERECTCYEYHGGHMPGCPAGRWGVGS